MSDPKIQIDSHGIEHFCALRDEAIAHALAASERMFPEVYARFGPKGRTSCAEDLGFHLDFLQPALETGDIDPFVAYLGWLMQVLSSRGVPHRSVEQSLDDLAGFFGSRMAERGASVAAALGAGKAALRQGIVAPTYDRPCPAVREEAIPYAGVALQGRREDAMALLDGAYAREQSLPEVAVHVIQPAMYEVGRRWQDNHVSAAQEQVATALSQTWMARARALATAAPDNGLRALFSCMTGNHHTMGLRMVADAFELDGWTTYNLGADASLQALIARVGDVRPHLVGLSASLPQHLHGLRLAVQGLRQALGGQCPRIVVGGLVINQFPRLAPWAGAEVLGADAVTAAAAALQLHGGRR
jgi:MerR family transcriptional regulator, light-induced transcriptional regulator